MMCFACELGLRSVLGDGQLALAGDDAVALDDRDLVLLHQPLDAGIELAGDLAAAVDDLGQVEADLLGAEPVGGGVGQIMVDLRGAQQRLGRDAPPVEADAAQFLALDDRRLEPELRGADRRDIAAGPRAEDDEVVGVGHCGTPIGSVVFLPPKRCRARIQKSEVTSPKVKSTVTSGQARRARRRGPPRRQARCLRWPVSHRAQAPEHRCDPA